VNPYVALSRRALFNTLRQPIAAVPIIAFPLIMMAMSSAALERSISLPGFPEVDSFLQFLVGTTVIQGAMFGAVAAGAGMANDIEGGFFERLIATPVSRTSIVVGRVAGAAALGFIQALIYLTVAFVFGMRPEGGMVGVALVAVLASTVSAGVGCLAIAFGLRSGSAEAVQGSFPLLFATLFLSSAFFPRPLMSGWFRRVADVNPLTYLIEGARAQIIGGVDLGDFARAIAVSGTIFVVGVLLANLALRSRLSERA
jgi:ABC-2 type transport system permease protein